jgi:hypothetical protein
LASSTGGDLAGIIEADAINHAVPTIDELAHAMSFLSPAGLVRVSNDSMHLTEGGKQMCQRAEADDIFVTLDRLGKLLDDIGDAAPLGSAPGRLSIPATYLRAYRRYMDEPS